MSDADEIPNPPTPRSSLGSGATISSSISSSSSSRSAVQACLDSWFNYLSVINSLCASGYKLAQSISTLEHWGNANETNPSTTNSWDDLANASRIATSTVKAHIMSVLQDFIFTELDSEQQQQRTREHNHQIILENVQTMINIQHQFCAASYDAFSSLICCLICHAPVGFPHEQDCAMITQKMG